MLATGVEEEGVLDSAEIVAHYLFYRLIAWRGLSRATLEVVELLLSSLGLQYWNLSGGADDEAMTPHE